MAMGRDLKDYIVANYQKALDYHYIQAYFQPVIRTISRKLCSFEALARWIDPQVGIIYPDEFIPVMEQLHVIHLLDISVIRQACARVRTAMDKREIPVPISVNLSRLDFTLCDIFSVVDGIVSDFQLPHDFIYIEITESVMAEEKDLMLRLVDQFRSAGYQIWMDDFGSAYSSLNLLKEYSFNELKLDMGFLRPFTQRSRRIATSVVEMAKGIRIHTLAEGVETEEQFRYLLNIGCEKVQGYYFGKPMPYEEALAHLEEEGIGIELPQDRKYYDDIGQVNILSAAPFMTKEEHDAITTARQLNSIPLALFEVHRDTFSILFYNTAFEKTASSTGMFAVTFEQDILRQALPFHLLSDKILNLMDSTLTGEEGRMHFTSHEDYYEIQAKCFSKTQDKYCVLLRMSNLSKASGSANTNHLDEFLRQIYALYERITLVDLERDSITPLYIATRSSLVSGSTGIKALAKEYAEKYLFTEDRDSYLELADPDTVKERFDAMGKAYAIKLFRTSVRHGQFAWKAYTLLRVDEDRFLMLISNVHDVMMSYGIENRLDSEDYDHIFTPDLLWRNLIESDLLRIFWKDQERRFIGASNAFLNYYGFSSIKDIIGKNDEDLGWHIHPDAYMQDEFHVIREGITTHNIPGWCMNEGENKEILASKAPLYDENGEIRGLMGYFIDKDLLTANDRRGKETKRRDILTGLLNTRGIAEEASAFRDEYYLRGMDFARIHIDIDDFNSLTEQYGFDYGDKLMAALGKALKKAFGRTCAVGRFAGHKFVVLHQVQGREEVHDLRAQIKSIGGSIQEIDGVPVTLYLSVGFVLFSEYHDLEEQEKKADVRLLADHDRNVSAESRMAKASEIFHLFDTLPFIYCVYHVTTDTENGAIDAVLFYINHKFQKESGLKPAALIGHSTHELFPFIQEEWYQKIHQASQSTEPVEGELLFTPTGKRYHFTAYQIIYPGYCAITYQEVNNG